MKNDNKIHNHLKKLGYDNSYYDYNGNIRINKELLIQILNGKYLSSQRNIKDEKHNEAMSYLKNNNYFLLEEERDVIVSEGFKIWVYNINT